MMLASVGVSIALSVLFFILAYILGSIPFGIVIGKQLPELT